jgi:hypothetical protein
MRSVLSGHGRASVRVSGPTAGGKSTEVIIARANTDCTGTRGSGHYTSAIRSDIVGTVATGKGAPRAVDTQYIMLSSGSTTGNNTRTTFWERDAARANHWRKVPTIVDEPAYAAFLAGNLCPSDGIAFRLSLGAHLAAPARGVSLGHPVWVIAGTSGTSRERFTFRILVVRSTFQLAGLAVSYVERVGGRVVARQRAVTTYSRLGAHFTIKAPA